MAKFIRIRGVRRSAGALLGLVVALGTPAVAGAACPTTPVSQPFARFGDTASYSFISGAEGSAWGWSLRDASVRDGNETHLVHAQSDSRSVAVEPGGRASTPYFCLSGEQHPSFRFFARQPQGGAAPDLRVSVRYYSSGGFKEQQVATLGGEGLQSWQPSPVVSLEGLFQDPDTTTYARIVFDVDGGAGQDWSVDDVYLDPWER